MASHVEGQPIDSPERAFSAICHLVVDQGPVVELVLITYAGKTANLLVLHQHGVTKVVDHEMWNNSRLVTTAGRWLAQCGPSGAEELEFVSPLQTDTYSSRN